MTDRNAPRLWTQNLVLAAVLCGGFSAHLCAAITDTAPATVQEPPVAIRLTWGGGKARVWTGTIRTLKNGAASEPGSEPLRTATNIGQWQTLCIEKDAATTVHATGDTIHIHEPRPLGVNGVQIAVDDWQSTHVVGHLVPDGQEDAATTFDFSIADILSSQQQQPLDKEGNRLTIRRAAGDDLRVVFLPTASAEGAPSAAQAVGATLRKPGERVSFAVHPLLSERSAGAGAIEMKVRIKTFPAGADIFAATRPLQARVVAPAAETKASDRQPQSFMPVVFEWTLPARESVYDIDIEVVERGNLRWERPIAAHTIQLVAVADATANPTEEAPTAASWNILYELDPGSPRLHERLRRLPGLGVPNMPIRGLPLPSMLLPAVAIPQVPLPKLPAVNLQAVASMVPRLSGLLAYGHSVVEAHAVGTMLRLPAARSAEQPTWEGIVVAAVQPGMPHLVEIEYPLDQDAVIGVSVLESNATHAFVQSRHSGGFTVKRSACGAAPSTGIGLHRFVFWPSTKNPLLLVSNPSTQQNALFGKVRILAGPSRLPVLNEAVVTSGSGAQSAAAKRFYAYLPTPDFSLFGTSDRLEASSGKALSDWHTKLSGVSRSAEWLKSQNVQGALVGVYADGGGSWPSQMGIDNRRWGGGPAFEAGWDPVEKDLLAVLCRTYAREGLRLVPGLAFNAPLPCLEVLRNSTLPEATGIACVGRDGKTLMVSGRESICHYNILDSRVQQAALDVVDEMAGRVAASSAVDGVATLLPHDGWMHLPGVAWGLDDATFARFSASIGEKESATGPDRFLRRAEQVEGPLRDRWLDWRAGVLASFYAQLADRLAAHNSRWSLYVVPTTLFFEGQLAARFEPSLSATRSHADVMREISLDPGGITAHKNIVYVSPHVHSAADNLLDESTIDNTNRALPMTQSVARAARRGVIIMEQPVELDVQDVLPHGPFQNARADGPFLIHAVPTATERSRALAESLIASEVEVVFDMGLLFGLVDRVVAPTRRSMEAMQSGRFILFDKLPAPLVVRTRIGETGTWLNVVNACGVPCTATVLFQNRPLSAMDGIDSSAVLITADGGVLVALEPWGVRTVLVDGEAAVRSVGIAFDKSVEQNVAQRLADLRRRRAFLEMPIPLKVLDNPSFDLPGVGGAVAGWELVEPKRGALTVVPAATVGGSKAVHFSSINGLATVRSNPFSPPATGRVSIAARFRLAEGDPQPPLRIALEGEQNDREYYRFAVVGGMAGGRPLGTAWSQCVLQVDDLPTNGFESLRVRLDLLGPGSVYVADVRVFDLAFDEQQRVQLSKMLALLDSHLVARDIGACVVELESHWPRFLETFISIEALELANRPGPLGSDASVGPSPAAPQRAGGLLEKMQTWWR